MLRPAGSGAAAAVHCTEHDCTGPGRPRIAWNDTRARAGPVNALVGDALRLLGHLPEQRLCEKYNGTSWQIRAAA